MIIAKSFKGQKIAVVGLGRTGVTAALSLVAGGAEVHAWDDNSTARKAAAEKDVPIISIAQQDWRQYDALVLSPGIPDKLPKPHWSAQQAQKHNVPIICDIEIFAREVNACPVEARPKIIAITGTNGKSTTTSLIGHILSACGRDAQVGGNIGRGVLDLDSMHGGAYYVLELSSYQLERTQSLRANAAVFLNLSPDHLDRHGDMKAYEEAKSRIFLNQTSEDSVIVGVDNIEGKSLCTRLIAKNGRRIMPISGKRSLGRGSCVVKGKLYCALGSKVENVIDLNSVLTLEGEHNWQNAAAAYAAVYAMGVDSKSIGRAIKTFPGLAHRMETIGTVGHLRYVNDSKATNADAARQALKSYDNIYWIAGGVSKAGGIKDLEPFFSKVKKAYLIGEAGPQFKKTLSKAGVSNKVSGSLDLAILCATKDALNAKGEEAIILLSPACASFDQFKNFEVRGDAFRLKTQEIIDMFEREKSGHALISGSAA